MKFRGLMAIACAAALTAACAGNGRDDTAPADDTGQLERGTDAAGERVGTTGTGATGVNGDVREFVEQAAHGGMAEVQLGQLASERAENPEVKKFGEMMVRDHTRSNEELKQAVAAHNIPVPADIDEEHRDLAEKLRGLRGAEFDREYMAAMVDSHREMQDLLENRTGDARDDRQGAAQTGPARETGTAQGADAAINQWALKAKTSVDQHLQMAEQIHDKLQGGRPNRTN